MPAEPIGSLAEQVGSLAAIAPAAAITVVAHSLGAVAAVLACANGVIRADRLVLIEPSLYDLARGNPAIERHIEVMARARDLAATGDLFGYWRIVRPLMFGGEADPANWDEERPRAEWFAAVPAPWGHLVTGSMIASTPTLVVTGGWNPEYEAIAAVLVAHGAPHEVVSDGRHRPHDRPEFSALLHAFEDR